MDLKKFLDVMEADFISRLSSASDLSATRRRSIIKHLDDAIQNTLILTYSRVVGDAKEKQSEPS